MNFKRLLVLTMVLMFSVSLNIWAAEEGENVFELEWMAEKVDFPNGIPYTLWDCHTMPDMNGNGRSELFVAADDPVSGAWYFVVEATANDVYEVVWHYYIQDCVASYVLNFTTEAADIDGDGLPELIAGVQQTAGSGLPGLYIWEKDTTITDAYPFPMDAPTCTYDVNFNGGSITCVFTGNFDADPNTELVIGETNDDIIYVVEETSGDLSFPVFEVEFQEDITYSPWGYYHGDNDADGLPDFGVGTSDYNSIRFFENNGNEDEYVVYPELQLATDVDGYCLRGMGTRDINQDGLSEVIYVRYTAPGKVFIVTNPGEIALIDSTHVHEIWVNPGGYNARGVAYGDMDHGFGSDGPDIYLVSYGEEVFDLEYIGPTGETTDPLAPGDPANWDVYSIFTDTEQTMQKVCAGDYDRDGEGELALIYSGSGDANYLKIIEHIQLPDAGFEVMWHDDPDPTLEIDPVFSNPRAIVAGSDVDQDGKKELICTEYEGKFHVYEVVADNTVEWVFSYKPGAPCTGSAPRDIKVGDVDGNGLFEIIAPMGASNLADNPDSLGFYFFEWDGSNDNGFGYAGGPTYILPATEIDPRLTAMNQTETIYIDDVDGDGNNEVMWPSNASGTGGDGLFIFSCIDGELTGFPTWLTEVALHRGSGEMTGSPLCVTTGDLNGNGQKEAIFGVWNNGQLNIFEALAPDTYEETIVYTDITMTDETIYKGMGCFDVDEDGDDELIYNMYWNSTIYIINSPENIADIDISNPAHFAWLRDDPGGSGLTGALGDQDQDGLPEFYFTLYTRGAVRSLEYNGGGADIMAQESYTVNEVYVDREFVYGDYYSAGVVSAVHGSFGVYAPEDDLDGDGRKEVFVSMIESPYSNTWLYVFEYVGPTGVKGDYWKVITPEDYKLSQNYPNPFNPNTSIEYYLPLDKQVTLKIYNSLGQEVKTLLNNVSKAAGHHTIEWNGTDNFGNTVTSGTYIYNLEAGNVKLSKTMTLLK